MNITKKINFGIFLAFLIFILILKQSFNSPSIVLKEKPIFQVKSAKSVENRSWNSEFRKIFFLKTHKTASSTIENIMMRLCWNYNKTLARPAGDKGINFSNYQPFSLKNLRKFNDSARIPTIFTQHAIFSKDIDKIYPKKETFSFTILRSTSFFCILGKKNFRSIEYFQIL